MKPTADTTPDDTERRYYECTDCGARTLATRPVGACPTCGGRLRNLAVPRE